MLLHVFRAAELGGNSGGSGVRYRLERLLSVGYHALAVPTRGRQGHGSALLPGGKAGCIFCALFPNKAEGNHLNGS